MGQRPSPRPLSRPVLPRAGLVSAGPEARCVPNGEAMGQSHQVAQPGRDPDAQPQQEHLVSDLTKFVEEHLVGKKSSGNKLK